MEDLAETSSKEVGAGWKVVQSRKGKPRTRRSSQGSAGKESISCCDGHSSNIESLSTSWDEEDELQLRAKIQKSKDRTQASVFFKKFIEQMESLKILETLIANANNKEGVSSDDTNSTSGGPKSSGQEGSNGASSTEKDSQKVEEILQPEPILKTEFPPNVLDVDVGKTKLKSKNDVEVVVLGVGSILDSEVSRCQLSLALLLNDQYNCIEKIVIYDPVLSRMECSVLTTLGCTPIVQDEKGRRPADSPTLFYMPHCSASLYNNLLEVNSNPWYLSWVCVLGNSFQKYQDSWSVFPKPTHQRPDCLLDVQRHVIEHAVDSASFPHLSAFNDMSWHLFPSKSTLETANYLNI